MTTDQALEFARAEIDRGIRNEQEKFRNEQTARGRDALEIEAVLKLHLAECVAFRTKALEQIEARLRGPTFH